MGRLRRRVVISINVIGEIMMVQYYRIRIMSSYHDAVLDVALLLLEGLVVAFYLKTKMKKEEG